MANTETEYRKRIFCVMLAYSKTSIMCFFHYVFFVAKSHVSVPFSWPFVGRIECNLLWIINE